MRLVQLKLRSGPFWCLPPINLNEQNPLSPFINVDILTKAQKETIEKASSYSEVYILDTDGNIVLDLSKFTKQSKTKNEDIQPQTSFVPQMEAVTVDDDEAEEEEKIVEITEKDFDEAMMILKRNGNTIKRIIRKMPKEKHSLLLACLQVEESGKNRPNILECIREVMNA